jgi:hypothetical protein
LFAGIKRVAARNMLVIWNSNPKRSILVLSSMQHLGSRELITSEQKHGVRWTMPAEMKIKWTK